MRPIVRAAIAAALLIAIGRVAERGLATPPGPAAASAVAPPPSAEIPCPAGSLPDDGACVPVPASPSSAPELSPTRDAQRDRLGRLESYEHIPLSPERPADYGRYALPIPLDPVAVVVDSGGIDLPAPRGTAVRVAMLEHAEGAPELLFAGDLFGTTVVTRHAAREGAGVREYLVLYGHLERVAPELRQGETLAKDAIVGFVGDTGSPGVVHLHLEVRRVREGIRVRELAPRELVHDARTIAVDPRNVLVLRAAP